MRETINETIKTLRMALFGLGSIQRGLVIAEKMMEGADVGPWHDNAIKIARRDLLSVNNHLEDAIARLAGWIGDINQEEDA